MKTQISKWLTKLFFWNINIRFLGGDIGGFCHVFFLNFGNLKEIWSKFKNIREVENKIKYSICPPLLISTARNQRQINKTVF
jgi:hypothetical protein